MRHTLRDSLIAVVSAAAFGYNGEKEQNRGEHVEKNKLKLLRVLDILRETDENHPVTAQRIVSELALYGIEAERKSVLRDIEALREYGYDILYCEDNKRGVYLASREFEDWELKILIDAVLSASFLTEANSRQLIDKLCAMAGADSRRTLRTVTPVESIIKIGDPTTKNHIDLLLKAVRLGRKVHFRYTYTDVDMEKQYKFDGHEYPVSPYCLIWRQDKYYLIGNYGQYRKLSYYRLDRIRDLSVTDEPVLPLRELLGDNADLQLREFVARNIYNYSGVQTHVTIRSTAYMIDTFIDYFGKDISIMQEDDKYVQVTVPAADGRGLYYWLMQYGENVEVLSPESVRNEVIERLSHVCRKYGILDPKE